MNKLLHSGGFTIIELRDANKNYPADNIALILDRKKRFLSFPMTAMEQLAKMIPTVKDGSELADILKNCNSIFCTDNGARQITTPAGRTAFYSVYLTEFGDDILDIIDSLETDEFFFTPEEVPRNFVPVVWRDGRCAGIVLDGKGLPNPHLNICGLSGSKPVILAILNTECYYFYAFFLSGFSAFIHGNSSFRACVLLKVFTTIIP